MDEYDLLDLKILKELQRDASASVADIGERVGLSQNACWRRIKQLEKSGLIRGRVALLNQEKLGLKLTAFVLVRTNQHNEKWLKQFSEGVKIVPEVVEFYRMSGDMDYLLKVLVRDMEDYDRVYKKLISVAPLSDVSGFFAMERIKCTTEIPV